MSKKLCFIALLLPEEIAAIATQWKTYCRDNFATQKAFNSPPHITLQPPFKVSLQGQREIIDFLGNFAQQFSPIPIVLNGFNCFPPRVIYIDVEPTAELLAIQAQVKTELADHFALKDERYGDRPFHPHVTIAFKDLSEENFYRAWSEFEGRQIYHKFSVPALTLLEHDGNKWQMKQTFPFSP